MLVYPNLREEVQYTSVDLDGCIASDDLENVKLWRLYPDSNSLIFTYHLVDYEILSQQAKEMEDSLEEFPDDKRRVRRIEKIIRAGAMMFPVFIQKYDKFSFVIEGRHRLVVFHRLNIERIPVLFVQEKA